jgi:hypothetical protein
MTKIADYSSPDVAIRDLAEVALAQVSSLTIGDPTVESRTDGIGEHDRYLLRSFQQWISRIDDPSTLAIARALRMADREIHRLALIRETLSNPSIG